jgi:hypothetical protein
MSAWNMAMRSFFPTDDKIADLRTADVKKTGCRYVFTDSASSGRQAA